MRTEVDERATLTERDTAALPAHLVEFGITVWTEGDQVGPVNQSPRRLRRLCHNNPFRQLLIVSQNRAVDQKPQARRYRRVSSEFSPGCEGISPS